MQRVFQRVVACIMCAAVIFGASPTQAEPILLAAGTAAVVAAVSWLTPKALDTLSDYLAQNNNDINAIEKKAQNGDAKAINNIGLIYYLGKNVERNYSEALRWWLKAANEHDYAQAHYSLGDLYYKGEGVLQNYSEAFSWFKKAAEQGHPQAQNILGCMYKNGYSLEKNREEAIKWYREAAKNGNEQAQEVLKEFGETW